MAITLTGCANLTSIWRISPLPGSGTAEGSAVHLDAKQRVVIGKAFGVVCAEPSPDAFTALAGGFGLGITTPQQAAASLASALAESGGSIGLRTQSITLMRDALYRVCEAYYNRALNQPMVMQLLQRYQNIMTAVLAIEQLTGAVAAPALAAAKQSSASASASLNDLQRQLEEALRTEKAKRDEFRAAAQTADDRKRALEKAQADLKTLQDKKDPPAAAGDIQAAQRSVADAQKQADQAQEDAAHAERVAKQASEVRQSIEKARTAALTSASASASGSVQFASASPRVQLSDAATQHIAAAVQDIVTKVFEKNYLEDSCLNFLAGELSFSKQVAQLKAEGKQIEAEKLEADARMAKELTEMSVREACVLIITERTRAVRQPSWLK